MSFESKLATVNRKTIESHQFRRANLVSPQKSDFSFNFSSAVRDLSYLRTTDDWAVNWFIKSINRLIILFWSVIIDCAVTSNRMLDMSGDKSHRRNQMMLWLNKSDRFGCVCVIVAICGVHRNNWIWRSHQEWHINSKFKMYHTRRRARTHTLIRREKVLGRSLVGQL